MKMKRVKHKAKASAAKGLMQEWQAMKAKAYSNLSLKRPLTDAEFKEYKSAFAYAHPAAFKKVFPKDKKPRIKL